MLRTCYGLVSDTTGKSQKSQRLATKKLRRKLVWWILALKGQFSDEPVHGHSLRGLVNSRTGHPSDMNQVVYSDVESWSCSKQVVCSLRFTGSDTVWALTQICYLVPLCGSDGQRFRISLPHAQRSPTLTPKHSTCFWLSHVLHNMQRVIPSVVFLVFCFRNDAV